MENIVSLKLTAKILIVRVHFAKERIYPNPIQIANQSYLFNKKAEIL
jgi:hypothetical protein